MTILQDRKAPGILFDSTPLYRPAKKGSDNGIKSIEISIKKTRRLGKLARSCSENSASSGEDIMEDREVTHGSQQGKGVQQRQEFSSNIWPRCIFQNIYNGD